MFIKGSLGFIFRGPTKSAVICLLISRPRCGDNFANLCSPSFFLIVYLIFFLVPHLLGHNSMPPLGNQLVVPTPCILLPMVLQFLMVLNTRVLLHTTILPYFYLSA